jgi:hypothetical protein
LSGVHLHDSRPRTAMATVLLTTHELRTGLLPRLCARCGEPTSKSVRLTVPTPMSQLGLAVFLIFCPPLFVALALFLKKRSSVELPMCPPHGADWRWCDRLTSITYLWAICGSYLAAWAIALSSMTDPLVPAVVYFFIWVAWVTPATILWTKTVRITKVTRWGVRLSCVDPAFVAALREDRARDADPARLPWHGDVRDDYDDMAD